MCDGGATRATALAVEAAAQADTHAHEYSMDEEDEGALEMGEALCRGGAGLGEGEEEADEGEHGPLSSFKGSDDEHQQLSSGSSSGSSGSAGALHPKRQSAPAPWPGKRGRGRPVGRRNLPTSAEEKRYVCEYPGCLQRYKTQPGLKYHQEKGHVDGKPLRAFPCPRCGRAFETEQLRRIHQFQHEEKAPTCDRCGRQFARLASLVRHASMCKGSPGSWLHSISAQEVEDMVCEGPSVA